jgi:hypothetical protein
MYPLVSAETAKYQVTITFSERAIYRPATAVEMQGNGCDDEQETFAHVTVKETKIDAKS